MDGGEQVHSLTQIAAVIDTDIKPLFFKFGIAHISPRLTPVFQRFGTAPVGSGNSVKEELAVLVSDTVSVLVQPVHSVLLKAPCPVRVHGAHGAEEMKVRVGYPSVLGLFLMECHINGHAPAHKVVQQKLPCQSDIFLNGKLVLQGNFKAVCKLGFLSPFHLFNGIPQGLTVCKFRGSVGW